MADEEGNVMFGGMPLLDGDDFFKELQALGMDPEFGAEGDGHEYERELDLGSEGGENDDDEETYLESPDYPDTPVEKVSRQEQLRMMHLRSHLNQLTEKVKHHQYLTEKNREELKQCRSKIDDLERERSRTGNQLFENETAGNTSAIHRLRSTHDRLCQELEDERVIEKLICERLETEEYELAKVDVERGKFLLAEDELIKKEDRLEKEKTDLALKRLNKEEKKAWMAEKHRRQRDKRNVEAMQERERHHWQLVDECKISHEKHSKFIAETMKKMKQREEEEDNRYKDNMQRKMDMLLKLKSDITANRENLKALRARDKAAEKREDDRVQSVRQKILDEGGNPDEILMIQKRIDDFDRQKSQFEASKKEKQASIMDKILIEEARLHRRKKQQPLLWDDPKREKSKIIGPQKKKPLKTFETFKKMTKDDTSVSLDLRDSLEERVTEKADDDTEKLDAGDNRVDILVNERPQDPDSSDDSDDDDAGVDAVDLAKPEFEGLWDQHKPYKVPKDVEASPLKMPGASTMDKQILSTVLEKHRAGIVVKQVAAGREFSGCPFYSKPDVIHFKDFAVGKTYKKKVTLTNVSYTVNYCKFLDITERLKDFIHIHFDPPGQMSAGLTCEMLVTFQPMINEDLEGEVKFLSQTGPFSIPLKCTTKKCDLSVDMEEIPFGTTVIDETLRRTFILSNKGALGTRFDFFKVTGMKGRTETSGGTSLGRLTIAGESVQGFTPEMTDTDKSKKEDKTSTDTMDKQKTEDEAKPGDEGQGQPVTMATADGEGQQEGTQEDGTAEQPTADGKAEGEAEATGEQTDDAGVSPDVAASEIDEYSSLDGMRIGPIAAGEIGPFSSVKLEILWNPSIPGKVDSEFLVTFTDPLSDSISIKALGNAIDVPVWVQRQTVDLKICMFDRLYQDTIVVSNRATTALRLKFEVCKELQNHLELLPKTGYIQAQSQFSAQLKFLPRHSLFEEAGKFFDKDTGVFEAPMTIRVADQTAPVPFTVSAVVTNSDMEFDVKDINFGFCTIYESTKTTIKLTNKSILPQEFGFVGHPEYVEVQPNDGFGTLLPLETIELEVVFSPDKTRDYKFDLCCKSLINREFKISCMGIGVYPPLELDRHVIHFAATSMYDVSTAAIHVVNSHVSTNEFTHPVPRIGKGDIAPVGPTSFEFVVPKDAPITVSPSVGTIEPGNTSRVQIRFAPTMDEETIKKEAVRMATRLMEQQADREYKEALKRKKEEEESAKATPAGGKGKGAAAKTPAAPRGKQTPGAVTLTVSGPQPIVPLKPEEITKDSTAYAAAVGSLLRQFKGKFDSFVVPCYVASGECSNPGELPYSIHNTLYLEVHCPTVKPPLVVISDSGKTTTDFGEVSLGQNIFKSITVQNISHKTLELSSTALETTGPFQVMNAFRILPPDATHTMLVSFTPNAGRVFQEVLRISSLTTALHLTLTGKGVSPLVNLSPSIDGGVMDMGTVLAGEYLEKTFKMQNTSSLSVEYSIKLESLSLLRHAHAQEIPAYLRRDGRLKTHVGIQNNNGQNVFDFVPANGRISPGGFIDITVTFAPDHPSDHFSDGIKIELFGKEEAQSFQVKGISKSKIMYIEGGDPLTTGMESLAVKAVLQLDEEDAKQPLTPVLCTLRSITKENVATPATRELSIGCVRTMAVSQKKDQPRGKNGEFQFDNLQQIAPKGFTIDPQKGMVEAGVFKPVTITWTPPQGHDPNDLMETTVIATLKGDTSEQFKILLRAMVVSE